MSLLVIPFHPFSGESSWIFFHLESQFFKSHNRLLSVKLILQPVVHRAGCVCVCMLDNVHTVCDRVSLESIGSLFVCATVDRPTDRQEAALRTLRIQSTRQQTSSRGKLSMSDPNQPQWQILRSRLSRAFCHRLSEGSSTISPSDAVGFCCCLMAFWCHWTRKLVHPERSEGLSSPFFTQTFCCRKEESKHHSWKAQKAASGDSFFFLFLWWVSGG